MAKFWVLDKSPLIIIWFKCSVPYFLLKAQWCYKKSFRVKNNFSQKFNIIWFQKMPIVSYLEGLNHVNVNCVKNWETKLQILFIIDFTLVDLLKVNWIRQFKKFTEIVLKVHCEINSTFFIVNFFLNFWCNWLLHDWPWALKSPL